jgi:hypothetical protein
VVVEVVVEVVSVLVSTLSSSAVGDEVSVFDAEEGEGRAAAELVEGRWLELKLNADPSMARM